MIHVFLLIIFFVGQEEVKSTMSTSPSISFFSYREISGELLKTGINDLYSNLCIFSSQYNVDIPKAVLIFLPIVFSQARRSAAALDLLGAGSFRFDPQLRGLFPEENWDQLFSSCFEACKLAITAKGDNPTIPEPGDEIGSSSRGRGLNTKSRRKKRQLKLSKS